MVSTSYDSPLMASLIKDEPRYAVPTAMVSRQSLIELAVARQAKEGQKTKMEMLYNCLTGPRFRQRVQAIVEKFFDMQEHLDKELEAMTRETNFSARRGCLCCGGGGE
jgi:hypothetical protein